MCILLSPTVCHVITLEFPLVKNDIFVGNLLPNTAAYSNAFCSTPSAALQARYLCC